MTGERRSITHDEWLELRQKQASEERLADLLARNAADLRKSAEVSTRPDAATPGGIRYVELPTAAVHESAIALAGCVAEVAAEHFGLGEVPRVRWFGRSTAPWSAKWLAWSSFHPEGEGGHIYWDIPDEEVWINDELSGVKLVGAVAHEVAHLHQRKLYGRDGKFRDDLEEEAERLAAPIVDLARPTPPGSSFSWEG